MPGAEYLSLPPGLPRPDEDHGAVAHLPGQRLPRLVVPGTDGQHYDLSNLGVSRAVVYLYPMIGIPGVPLPDGWDLIPGARGCTPESCGFRDQHAELAALNATVLGLSSQSNARQREAAERLALPFPLVSDQRLALADELSLPTFTVEGTRLFARLTLVVTANRVEHVFYPVFPPDRHAEEVVEWLRAHPRQRRRPTVPGR